MEAGRRRLFQKENQQRPAPLQRRREAARGAPMVGFWHSGLLRFQTRLRYQEQIQISRRQHSVAL